MFVTINLKSGGIIQTLTKLGPVEYHKVLSDASKSGSLLIENEDDTGFIIPHSEIEVVSFDNSEDEAD